MAIDKKELTKLSPKERIKKLKFMEEERKKEVSEIGELIKKSMQELRTDKLAEEVAPEQRSVDISRLFETTSGQRLERTAREGASSTASMKGAKGYQAIAQTYEAYSQLQKIDKALSMYGSLSEEQVAAIGQIGEKLSIAEKYMTESEKIASKLDASRNVLYKLKKETGLN